ncbi:TetR/AcrR family transcriptional regulator [Paenibacillus guangzhouensis]|uniref:TetR/AcrR family transcriptional regulator n=1 Tax=Paenibacillus guangzhouensis TaxID=1473112 RepID=UPI00187BBC5F|nr:TetR/AcrR family transcriptional regulator [Paenibacillus guangzhouensis]
MSLDPKQMDPRIKRTLLVIRDAMIGLMHEKGFEHVTVRDITQRAEINRATFYRHYVDKYELLDKIVEDRMTEFTTAISLPSDFTFEDLSLDPETPPSSFICLFEHIAQHAMFYRLMLSDKGIPGFAGRMEQIIRESFYHRLQLAERDTLAVKTPMELVARYATSAHLGLMTYWLEAGMPYTPAFMALQLKRLHMLGPTQVVTNTSQTKSSP